MSDRFENQRFPYLHISLELRGQRFGLEAPIDTGFDGDLTLPASIAGDIGPADQEARATLADGSQLTMPAYIAQLQVGLWDPFAIHVLVIGDEPTVGRRVTDRFRLVLDHGQRVIVEP